MHMGNIPPCKTEEVGCGSSPCIWGTWFRKSFFLTGRRFIPMHMGNIIRAIFFAIMPSVHPHAYGEHKLNSDSFAV
ncbi:hypothetical protein CHISP_1487 [Chitinispirillum alkaliphilum]|nr:hypothetical protein CHISP_1487 [Chitinispirillum alkaliphilum]